MQTYQKEKNVVLSFVNAPKILSPDVRSEKVLADEAKLYIKPSTGRQPDSQGLSSHRPLGRARRERSPQGVGRGAIRRETLGKRLGGRLLMRL